MAKPTLTYPTSQPKKHKLMAASTETPSAALLIEAQVASDTIRFAEVTRHRIEIQTLPLR
jgi:hypothetical protein